ncbi:MAG TPA: EAL domain-containing protein [Ktedonobacterales bacterium]|nr:EAL domain-containing protein [Ktedonobacterales bacterium]
MRQRPTIRTYLLVGFSLLATLPVLLLGILQSTQLADAQVRQDDQQVASAAYDLANAFQQYLDLRIAEIDGFARQVEAQPGFTDNALEGLLIRHRVASGHLAFLALGDRTGTWLATQPLTDLADNRFAGHTLGALNAFQTMRRTGADTVAWPAWDPVTGGPALQVLAPTLSSSGTLAGFVDAALEPADLSTLARTFSNQTLGLQAVILDDGGRVMTDLSPVLGADPSQVGGLPLYAPVGDAIEYRVSADKTGALVRAAAAPVRTHGLAWTALVAISEASVQEQVGAIRRQAFMLGAAALLVAVLLSGLIAHLLTAPMRQLARSATAVGAGDLEQKPPRSAGWHPREMAVLAHEIGGIMRRLHARREELELEVAQRTAALQASESYFRALIEHGSDLITGLDAQMMIRYISPSHETVLGYSPDQLLGHSAASLIHPDDAGMVQRRLYEKLRENGTNVGSPLEFRLLHADGGWRWVEAVATAAPPGLGFTAVINSRDITQRKATDDALTQLALYDALTRLPNRSLFHDRIGQALQGLDASASIALLVLDLDGFKEINDSFGHQVGDGVLEVIGQRLTQAVRVSDTVARLGGDEFAIVLPATDAEEGLCIAHALTAVLEQPLLVDGHALQTHASIGIASAPIHSRDPSELLRCADVAMYVAKREGSGAVVYSAYQDRQAVDKRALAADLKQAIANGGLELHYQPKVSLISGQAIGVEALARWHHPQRGLIPPDTFVPLAEETGVIGLLTRWALTTALDQLRTWLDDGLDISVAVNLSALNLPEPDLAQFVQHLLETNGVPPNRLQLELTESSLMTDPAQAVAALQRLRDMGIGIAVDDFGTGYSSLAYLKRLPVDELKIDKSFIRHLARDDSDAAIVRSTIGLAHDLGLTVVAEGVEDEATWQLLMDLDCDVVQGFFLARPAPQSEITAWLLHRRGELSSAAA